LEAATITAEVTTTKRRRSWLPGSRKRRAREPRARA
jgi:hypothetical protein